MDKKELDQLYDRLNSLPESYQSFVLASLSGRIGSLAQDNDSTAIFLINVVKESVEHWEGRLN